jgi:UDP-glucose 4-epimerase
MIVPPKNSARLEYATGKLACEIATRNVAALGKIHATVVRPFNATGPRQSSFGGFVLPRFLSQALKGEPLTVYGDGSQVRAFTHVKDIARGVVLMMERGTSGAAYNIGNPANKTTVLELAELVIETTCSKSEISFIDPKTLWGPLFEECADKYPDVERAITDLNWHPYRTLYEIVRDSAEYIREGRRD